MARLIHPVKRLSIFFLSIFACLSFITPPVSAHIIKTDGAMTVEMHIDSIDEPISQTPTPIIIEFSDSANLFTLPRCDCQLSVLKDNRIVAIQKLDDKDLLISEINYTFQDPGGYILRLTGRPQQNYTFAAFTVSYNFNVKPKVTAQSTVGATNSNLHGLVFGTMLVFVLLAAYALKLVAKRRSLTKKR